MKLAGLFSGGKDSTFAVWKAIQEGHEIVSLVAFVSENPDSYMFHHPNIQLTRLQARSMELPIIMVPTKGEKEKELKDIENVLKRLKPKIEGVTAGALASQYQKTRIETICKKLGLEVFSPAWHQEVEGYWNQLLEEGFRIIITKVACEGLGKEWLGREIDRKRFEELKQLSNKFHFHLGFEGGEAETFVIDCPLFRKRIEFKKTETIWDKETGSGFLEVKNAVLMGK